MFDSARIKSNSTGKKIETVSRYLKATKVIYYGRCLDVYLIFL